MYLTKRKMTLSKRESEILFLAAMGLSIKETASKLCIGERTVKQHRQSIVHKREAKNLTHAIVLTILSQEMGS